MRRALLLPCLALLALVLPSCADDAQVEVKTPPSYTPAAHTVSVFGVFRDGRMSPESWAPIGTTLSTALGQPDCAVGYGDDLQATDAELYARIDAVVRSEGINEELVSAVAPKAGGDLILIISIHGRAALPVDDDTPQNARPRRSPSPPRGQRGQRRPGPRPGTVGGSGFELAATFYTVKSHEPLARISVRTAGKDVDAALHKLAAEITRLVPGASCKGWSWTQPSVPVPPAEP